VREETRPGGGYSQAKSYSAGSGSLRVTKSTPSPSSPRGPRRDRGTTFLDPSGSPSTHGADTRQKEEPQKQQFTKIGRNRQGLQCQAPIPDQTRTHPLTRPNAPSPVYKRRLLLCSGRYLFHGQLYLIEPANALSKLFTALLRPASGAFILIPTTASVGGGYWIDHWMDRAWWAITIAMIWTPPDIRHASHGSKIAGARCGINWRRRSRSNASSYVPGV